MDIDVLLILFLGMPDRDGLKLTLWHANIIFGVSN